MRGKSLLASLFLDRKERSFDSVQRPPQMQTEIFELLFNSAEIAKFTPEEKIKYEFDMTTERDIRNQIAYGREEGRAEGRAEEKARFEEEMKRIARSLLEKGVPKNVVENSFGMAFPDL